MSIDWKNNYDDIKDKENQIHSQMDETFLVVANDINVLKNAGKETREQLEALTIGDLTIIGFVPRLNQREGSYEKFTSGLDNDLEPRIKIGVGELTALGASNKNGDLNIAYDINEQRVDFAFETNLTRIRRPETIVLWSDIQGLLDNGIPIDKVQYTEQIIDTHTVPGKENTLMNSWMTQKDAQDTILFQNIDTINTNLISTNVKIDNEIITREETDIALQSQIDSIVGFDLSDYYTTEDVDTLISNEATLRVEGDNTLQENITLEEEERISGDTQLQSQIDGKLNISNEGISFFGTNYNNEQESKITVASFGPNQSTIDFTVNNKSLQFSELEDGRVWFVSLNTLDKGSPQAFAQMIEINDLQNQINSAQGNIEVVASNIIENKKESSTGLGVGTYPATPTKGAVLNFNFPSFTGTYYSTSASTLVLNDNADTFDFGAKLNINNAQNAKIVEILVNGVVYESKSIPSTNSQVILFNVTMKNVVAGSYLIQFRIENLGGNLVITSAPTFYFGYGVYGTTGATIVNSSDIIDDHLTSPTIGINNWMNHIDSGKIDAFNGSVILNGEHFFIKGGFITVQNFENDNLDTSYKTGVGAINELNLNLTNEIAMRAQEDNVLNAKINSLDYSSYIGMTNLAFYNMFSSYFVADTTGTMRLPSNSLFTYLMDTIVDGGFSSGIKGGYYEPTGSTDNYIVFMIFGKLPI